MAREIDMNKFIAVGNGEPCPFCIEEDNRLVEDIFINDKYLKRFRSSLFSGETTSSTTNILEGLDGILKTNSTPAESTNVKMQINNDWNQYLNSEMNK